MWSTLFSCCTCWTYNLRVGSIKQGRNTSVRLICLTYISVPVVLVFCWVTQEREQLIHLNRYILELIYKKNLVDWIFLTYEAKPFEEFCAPLVKKSRFTVCTSSELIYLRTRHLSLGKYKTWFFGTETQTWIHCHRVYKDEKTTDIYCSYNSDMTLLFEVFRSDWIIMY